MRRPPSLLDDAKRLINELVELHPAPSDDQVFAARLDVVERLIELLRLDGGQFENRLPMRELLRRGVRITPDARPGTARLIVGGEASVGMAAGRARCQSELQTALLLHLFHARSKHQRIGDDLQRFVAAVRNDLGPLDVETTRTGVMRIATSTRDAARALRLYGLIRDTDETRTRTWQLSLLGILTTVELSRNRQGVSLPPLEEFSERFGRFAESERLAAEVEDVVRTFTDDQEVAKALQALCVRDADVFSTFDTVVRTLARYCAALDAHWQALDAQAQTRTPREIRAAAEEMLRAVEAAVPPGAFAEDANKSLSLDQLPGFQPGRSR